MLSLNAYHTMETEQKKKIIYLITKSNFFGAQKYVYELAVEAKNRGHEVIVACGGTGEKDAKLGTLADKLQEADIRVHPITHFMRDMSLLSDLRAMVEVVTLLFKEQPDILHSTSSKAGGIGAFCGRLVGIKRLIFTSHGLTMDETWRPLWQRILIAWSTWFTMLLSHHSILISTETYKRVQKMPLLASRTSLIFNGIAPIVFKDRTVARHELADNISDTAIWIGGIGELHPNKNWQSLVETIKDLPTAVHLFIIGEGEERERLEKQIDTLGLSKRVHLLGYLDGAQYLQAFDFFVLPSKKEGLPYVLLEAGLAGLPTIASDLPGNHDIITPGETGLLIQPTPALLKESLLKLLDDGKLRNELGDALQQKVSEKFSIHTMHEKTFATYLLK